MLSAQRSSRLTPRVLSQRLLRQCGSDGNEIINCLHPFQPEHSGEFAQTYNVVNETLYFNCV